MSDIYFYTDGQLHAMRYGMTVIPVIGDHVQLDDGDYIVTKRRIVSLSRNRERIELVIEAVHW